MATSPPMGAGAVLEGARLMSSHVKLPEGFDPALRLLKPIGESIRR